MYPSTENFIVIDYVTEYILAYLIPKLGFTNRKIYENLGRQPLAYRLKNRYNDEKSMTFALF